MPFPVTLDPLECKNIIRHLNGTYNEILNNLHNNKTFTLLEDHYFQERLEQFQTPFTVNKLNKRYRGLLTKIGYMTQIKAPIIIALPIIISKLT